MREAGKPVIVSMGAAAASGGYYIACPADVIVALPATLTGSIGVFGGKVVVRELLDRIGLSTGSVAHGARVADVLRPARGSATTNASASWPRRSTRSTTTSSPRSPRAGGRPVDEIEAIARGRVWTGTRRAGRRPGRRAGRAARRRAHRARTGRSAGQRTGTPRPPRAAAARLGRPKNSEDPRALARAAALPDLAGAVELPVGASLRMPSLRVR